MTNTVKKWGIAVQGPSSRSKWGLLDSADLGITFYTKQAATKYWKDKLKDDFTRLRIKSKIVRVNISYQFDV